MKKGTQTISSPKWSIRSLVTPKKQEKYSWEAAPGPVNFFLILWKKFAIFVIFNDYLGHFRGVSLLNFFWLERLFLSYRTNNLKKVIFCDFDPICIFLTIDFCENLQEHFFVWNQFLFIKRIRKNAKIFYKFNILAKVMSHTNEMKKNAKI